jgi:hypothetical protein
MGRVLVQDGKGQRRIEKKGLTSGNLFFTIPLNLEQTGDLQDKIARFFTRGSPEKVPSRFRVVASSASFWIFLSVFFSIFLPYPLCILTDVPESTTTPAACIGFFQLW